MENIELALQPLEIVAGYGSCRKISVANNVQDICEEIDRASLQEAVAAVWLEQEIAIVRAGEELKAILEENIGLWLEMRIFSRQGELYLCNQGDWAVGRLRVDGTGEAEDMLPQEYVDTVARFWGKCEAAPMDGSLKLQDKERKLSLSLPLAEKTAKFYGLVTRNYVGENSVTHQAGYVDYRYMAICEADV